MVAFFAGMLGSAFGYGLSFIIAYSIFGYGIGVAWIMVPLSIAFALLISIVGSIVPMKNLVKLLPAEVLYDRK